MNLIPTNRNSPKPKARADLRRLRRLRNSGQLTDAINLLEAKGVFTEEFQLFILNEVGVAGGEI